MLFGAGYYSSAKALPSPLSFQFHGLRTKIDWRVLHGIDVDELVCLSLCIRACSQRGPAATATQQRGVVHVCMTPGHMWQVRTTDIDTLERCVNAVAYGDLEAEGHHGLTQVRFSAGHPVPWLPSIIRIRQQQQAMEQSG